jgi:ferredoxin-NADP reductase
VPAYSTRLQGRRDLTADTAAFTIARPEAFSFAPGQSINVTLVEPAESDAKGNTRTFSLTSAPHEPFLEVATRLRTSAFKRALATLAPGAPLQIRGPGGRFTLPEDEVPVVLLAAGIGITPFVSMLRAAAHARSQRAIVLIHANRRLEDAAYHDELAALRRHLPHYRLVTASTGAEPDARAMEHGAIDAAMVARHAAHLSSPIHYLAGPPAMVAALRTSLLQSGVKPESVRLDEFYGY